MSRYKLFISLIVGLFTLTHLTEVQAQSSDGEDFQTLVHQLAASTRSSVPKANQDFLGSAVIHGGIGFTNSFSTLRTAGGQHLQSRFEGLQASLGIDLFSPSWMVEGTAASFGEYGSASTTASLRQFDMRVINKGQFLPMLSYRLGGGLSARYLHIAESITTQNKIEDFDNDYTTPSSLALLGLDVLFTEKTSLGAEASYRSALIGDTIDHVSYDLMIRLDAHF